MSCSLTQNSSIQGINRIRKELWESIYSNFNNLNTLATAIRTKFSADIIKNIDFKFEDMTIVIDIEKPLSNIEINAMMTMAYKDFIQNMFTNNKISKPDYDICMQHPDMLFLLTFKSENSIVIHL